MSWSNKSQNPMSLGDLANRANVSRCWISNCLKSEAKVRDKWASSTVVRNKICRCSGKYKSVASEEETSSLEVSARGGTEEGESSPVHRGGRDDDRASIDDRASGKIRLPKRVSDGWKRRGKMLISCMWQINRMNVRERWHNRRVWCGNEIIRGRSKLTTTRKATRPK